MGRRMKGDACREIVFSHVTGISPVGRNDVLFRMMKLLGREFYLLAQKHRIVRAENIFVRAGI
jgi:hypothetical protein